MIYDPKGLIRESYRMDGICDAQCRSILLDWALSLDPQIDPQAALRSLLDDYGTHEGHPMTALLREGLSAPRGSARRRRGRSG